MDQCLINHFDLKLCLTVAVLSMLLIVVLLYSKEVDPDQYRFEYIRSTLSEDELKRIDGLDEEGRRIAYEKRSNEFSYKQILECRNYVNENKPKTSWLLKVGLLSLISAALVMVLSPVYKDYKTAQNEYNEMLRLQEEAYNQIIEDEYITLDGLPTIHVIPGNSLKIGDVQKYMDLFVKSQPNFLLSNCRMIHICEPKNFIDIAIADGVDVTAGGQGTAYAYASSDDFSITLQIDFECSGIIEIMAFISLLAFFNVYNFSEKVMVGIGGFCYIMLCNALRIVMICMSVYFWGMGAYYVVHTFIGRIFFYVLSVYLYFYVFTKPQVIKMKVGSFSYGNNKTNS